MTKPLRIAIFVIFAIGAAVRLADVARPIDRASWRESDVGAVARNFASESMNILYPRIDWRGNTPGFVEMEFPLYPFAIALSHKAFGVDDRLGRFLAFGFSIVTLLLFLRLTRGYLDGFPLVAAFAFFAFNPLIVEFSTSIQPEGLMLVFYISAAVCFRDWIESGRDRDLLAAASLTALALLAKATAAHIGIFFVFLLVRRYGLRAFARWRVWAFAAASLVPAALWYAHAKGFWTTYGNSLGVSNEYHWIGPDFLTNPYFVKGIALNEIVWVWSVGGLAVGAIAIVRAIRERPVADALVWLGACFLFYVAAARTSADDWAAYYHIFSVAPVAILFGAGIRETSAFAGRFADGFSSRSVTANAARVASMALIGFVALLVFAFDALKIRARILENRSPDASFACARYIGPKLAKPGPILVSGDRCLDPDGYAVAYNASFMFYWLERKGFNICVEEQSATRVRAFANDGARYFVAQRHYLDQKPGFESQLRDLYPVVAECGEFVVFDLTDPRPIAIP